MVCARGNTTKAICDLFCRIATQYCKVFSESDLRFKKQTPRNDSSMREDDSSSHTAALANVAGQLGTIDRVRGGAAVGSRNGDETTEEDDTADTSVVHREKQPSPDRLTGFDDVGDDDPRRSDVEICDLREYTAMYHASLSVIENREFRDGLSHIREEVPNTQHRVAGWSDDGKTDVNEDSASSMPWEDQSWHIDGRRERRSKQMRRGRLRSETTRPNGAASRGSARIDFSQLASSLDWDGEDSTLSRLRPEDQLVPLFDEIDVDINHSTMAVHHVSREFTARMCGAGADDEAAATTLPLCQRVSKAARRDQENKLRERRLQVGKLYSYLGIEAPQSETSDDAATAPAASVLRSRGARSLVFSADEFEAFGSDDEITTGTAEDGGTGIACEQSSAFTAQSAMNDTEEACVDSGTSVPVDNPNKYDKNSIDQRERLTLMGFNKSTTRSAGVLYETVAVTQGRHGRVRIKLPKTHLINGAPNALLSVSQMCNVGYEFHFTKSGGVMVTPDGEQVDLVLRSGLYWLRFRRATPFVDQPHRIRADRLNNSVAEAMACDSSLEDQCICTTMLDNDAGIDDSQLAANSVARDERSEPILVSNYKYGKGKCLSCKPDPHSRCGGAIPSDVPGAFGLKPCSCPLPDTATAPAAEHLAQCFHGRVVRVPLQLLHARLGHANEALCRRISKQQLSDVQLSDVKLPSCEICKEAKAHRASFRGKDEEDGTLTPFEYVSSDLKGKMKHADVWGNRYFMTICCKRTRWICVYFLKKKSEAKHKLLEFLNWAKRFKFTVKTLKTDGGGEFTAGEEAKVLSDFEKICDEHGITHVKTSADTPEQNAQAERVNRTLAEKARSMLRAQALSPRLWSSAVLNACALSNRLPQMVLGGVSPHHHVFDRPPTLSRYRVFGCDMWKMVHEKADLTEPKAIKGIYLGVSSQKNRMGWLFYDPETQKVSTTVHAQFNESSENRRCALRSFDLRQQKAGEGSTADEEIQARAVRENYALGDFGDLYDEPDVDAVGRGQRATPETTRDSGPLASRSREQFSADDESSEEEEEEEIVTSRSRRTDRRAVATPSHRNGIVGARQAPAQKNDDDANEAGFKSHVRRRHRRLIPHPDVESITVPVRRRVPGVVQPLSEEDLDFMDIAFELDLPLRFLQRNPKQQRAGQSKAENKSRLRYEAYKGARTLREAVRLGASIPDVKWDHERGHINWDESRDEQVQADSVRRYENRGPNVQASGYVNAVGEVVVMNDGDHMTFEDSLRSEYSLLAQQHVQELPTQQRRLLSTALGGGGVQTLLQFAISCATRIIFKDPVTISEALSGPDAAEWRKAIDEEVDSLINFNVFEIVTKETALKAGKLMKSKWIFKTKRLKDGSIERRKVRLVGCGYSQIPGKHFLEDETYAPVMGYSSLRVLLSTAAANDMMVSNWDIASAFLQQSLGQDHVYMASPPGVKQWEKINGEPAALKCIRSLYGLRQSSYRLNQRLNSVLEAGGFVRMVADQCLYRKGDGDDEIIVGLWCDDIVVLTHKERTDLRQDFDELLKSVFVMSPWTEGEAEYLLNINIDRDWSNGTLKISQPQAIVKLAEAYGLADDRVAPLVPMDPNLKLKRGEGDEIIPEADCKYAAMVGSLLYLSLTCRPDIATSVGVLSRFMACPTAVHVEAARRVISYAYANRDLGIVYRRDGVGNPVMAFCSQKEASKILKEMCEPDLLSSFADADLAGDISTRRSTSGVCILLNGGLVAWIARLQPTVSLSTAESECIATTDCVKLLMHLRLLLRELGRKQEKPTVVYEDNQAAVKLVEMPEQSKKAKHYQMKLQFLKDMRSEGIFRYDWISTKVQLADAMTKCLPRDSFCNFRNMMGMS